MQHKFIDEYAYLQSSLHRLDPRAKLAVLLGFILCVVFTPPGAVLAYSLYSCLLAALILISRIPLAFLAKRSLVILPFVLMIGFFRLFTGGGAIFRQFNFLGMHVSITCAGLAAFLNIVFKSALSVLCLILLVSTTPFTLLLKALGEMRVPKVFIMIISFMYRYIFVITEVLMQLFQAKKSRSLAGGSKWLHTKALANMLGVLFLKSYEKGEAVYLAMCSRGFSGEIKVMEGLALGRKDAAFMAAAFTVMACIKIFAG